MRRWIKVSITAVLVLGLAGWIARPYVDEWWTIRTACDGALPGDAVRDLLPEDAGVTDTASGGVEELGDYRCEVTVSEDGRNDWPLLNLRAYTLRDDQDREFLWLFPKSGFGPQMAMPEGLPGFIGRYGELDFLLPCPTLGKDADGRQRKMLVSARIGQRASWRRPASYEVAVAFVNSASEQLRCGARPLKAPKGVSPVDPEKDKPKRVPLSAARDTPCGWLADAGLPDPTRWRLDAQLNDGAPTGRCDVSLGDDLTDGDTKRMNFVAWFGDWSDRLVTENASFAPTLAASARCGGEAAHFAFDSSDGIPGVDAAKQRALLDAFVRAQAEQRGCTEVKAVG
ncbi:hypothetical protein [Streptomyces bobili]|uniref:hypothetical protein n=1 Tax=Streptomyces bobili TaxID=67280 RepID=UPI00117D8209|nr:hypothetical protein [Streptomyces bobili]